MITILLANFAICTCKYNFISYRGVQLQEQWFAEPDGTVQKTINTILLAWFFTLPVTALMSAGYMFVIFLKYKNLFILERFLEFFC